MSKFDDMENFSNTGVYLAKRGVDLRCPHCGQILRGQRYCPQCGMLIKYAGETDKSIRNDIRLAKAGQFSDRVGKSSEQMLANGAHINQGCGCLALLVPLLSIPFFFI